MLSKETVIHLLQNPRKVVDHPEDDLRQLAEAYPYSQPLQLLYAARLRYSNEHLFQRQLGRTALITNDRSVLFELFEEEAPLQEQAQQVSESHEWDEVSPEEWDLASRPKEPAPEDEAASSDYSATPPPEPAPTAEAAAGETDLEAQAETAASPPAGEQPGENAEKTTPPKTGPIDTSPEPDKAEEADHAATASKASVPDGSSPAEEKAEPLPLL